MTDDAAHTAADDAAAISSASADVAIIKDV